jgi:hypothetical protein
MAVIRATVKRHSEQAEISRLVDAARAEGYAEAVKVNAELRDHEHAALEKMSKQHSELRYALGTLDAHVVGRAVKAISSLNGSYGSLNALRVEAKRLVSDADALEAMARQVFGDDREAAE